MENKKIHINLLLLLFFILHKLTVSANECDFYSVESSVEKLLQKYPAIPGVGLQIGYADEIIYEQYWGQYDENTIVPLASATKLLSGITIMALVDAGLIDLDEPVNSYLPQFIDEKGQMTVRQMFSHTAGMPNNAQLQNWAILNARNGLTLEQAVNVLACCEPLSYSPGTGFSYGGSSMHIAGRIAEVVSGQSWIDVFNQYLAIPLKINSMDFDGLGVTKNYRIAGGAQSSLADYGKILNMLLNKGRFQSGRVLSEQAVAEISTDIVDDHDLIFVPPQVDGEVRYGIGTWLRADENKEITGLFSPGAFGFTPWVDYDLQYYAAFMVKDRNSRMAAPISEIRDQIREILSNNWCGSKTQALTDEFGLWFDPEFSGHGFEIQKVGDNHSGIFYTYTKSGQPEWYLLNVTNQTGKLNGDLLYVTNKGSSNAIEPMTKSVGSFSINFNPSSNTDCTSSEDKVRAEITWNINDEQAVWCLQPLLTVNSRVKTNPNGWWWNGIDDSGWGFNVYANDRTEFRIMYYYNEAGNPIWALATGETEAENFIVQSARGYCRTCNMTALQLDNIGSFAGKVDATLINGNSGSTISLDINNWQRIDFEPTIFSNPAY